MVVSLPQLRRDADLPLVEQIAAHFREAIQQGRLTVGDRLPTIRAVAEDLSVTRQTVQESYRRLADEGLVASTVGRGTVVAETASGGESVVFSAGANAAWSELRGARRAPSAPPGTEIRCTFADLLPDKAQFPVEGFRASLERVLRDRGGDLLVYGHPMGDGDLRDVLAERSDEPGGAEEFLITSGAQQAIDLVLRTFTGPGDAVAVVTPTYHHLFGLLRSHQLELVPVPQGEDGIDLDVLETVLARPEVRLLYLMPTFHNPTGRTVTEDQRRALAEVVARTQVPVLEDEFQHELRFRGDGLTSLRALDPRGLTVTVGTFSKGLFPGIRTGWVRATPDVLGRIASLKRLTDLDTSPLLQAALVDFIAEGAFDRYLGELRAELSARHEAATRALARAMPVGSTWTTPDGGYVLWVELPDSPGADSERLADLAAARGVLVTPGCVFEPGRAPSRGARLSLSRVSAAEITRGIETLATCAAELLDGPHPSRQRIFL